MMHPARLVRLAAALLLATLPLGCGQGEADSGGPALADGPIEVAEARITLDPVRFGESRIGSFRLRNTAEEPQLIERIGPASCGCTSLRLLFPERADTPPLDLTGRAQDIELRAGETVIVEVTFDTARLRRPVSRRTDSFAVMVAGARGLILEYAIDVWTPFWVEPWSVDLGRVGVRERATGFATVKAHDAESGFALVVPEQVDGWDIQVNAFDGSSGGADYSVEFLAPPELPYGPFEIQVPITTDLPDSPTLTVWVRGIGVGDVDWSPRQLVLLPDANEKLHAEVTLRSRAPERPLGLRAVALEGIPQEFLQIESQTLEPERAYQIVLRGQQAPADRLEGVLVIVTDDPDTPRIEVPVVIRPRP